MTSIEPGEPVLRTSFFNCLGYDERISCAFVVVMTGVVVVGMMMMCFVADTGLEFV